MNKQVVSLAMAGMMLMSSTAWAENTASSVTFSVADQAVQLTNGTLSDWSMEALQDLQTMIEEELALRGSVAYYDLEFGNKGDEVAAMQTRLKELGYYSGNITAKFDNPTRQALKQFEKVNGLKNDGMASAEDQKVLYSDQAVGKAKPTPQPTANQTEVPDIENVEAYVKLDYEQVMRYPEEHKAEMVQVNGRVLQVLSNVLTGTQIRLSVGSTSDVVYVFVPQLDYNLLENDRVTIYGTLDGLYTYTSLFGKSITIPKIYADSVILHN